MTDHLTMLLTLAQDGQIVGDAPAGGTEAQPVGPGNQNQQSPTGLGPIFPILLAVMAFMIVSTILSGRKEKKKRAEMMSSLAKHDRVQTVGGIIGTIQEIRDDEVVLRVDESSNTRIRFSRASIQQVLKSSGRAAEPADDTLDDHENPYAEDREKLSA